MNRLAEACDGIVRWGLVGLIVFTPLAFGTVESWSIAIMEWGIVTLILIEWAGHTLRGGMGRARFLWRTGLVLPLALFLLMGALQMVALPRPWLEVLAPGSARLYALGEGTALRPDAIGTQHVNEMVQKVGLEPMPDRRPITVNPEASGARIELLAVLFGLFLLVAVWADRGERILFLLGTLTIVGFAVALFGLVQHLTWNGYIYWVRRVPRDSAFGPFVNHNHFAGYVEMLIPVALSLAFFLFDARRDQEVDVLDDEKRADPLATPDPESFAKRWGQCSLAFFAAIVLVAALFLSESRGGILSALLSALVLFVLIWRRISSRILTWTVAVALPILTLLFTLWVGADLLKHYGTTLQAVEHEASFRSRWLIWVEIVRHLPLAGWAGHGMGAFEDSFAAYTPAGSAARWDRAHNDYLQLIWEAGIVGGLLLLWSGFVLAFRYFWPALRARAHPLDLFRVGLTVSLLSLLLHSFVDFNLQIGANGFLFALLAGLLVAVHWNVQQSGTATDGENEEVESATPRLQVQPDGRIV